MKQLKHKIAIITGAGSGIGRDTAFTSDKSSFVTGSYYPVDGGYLAQ